MVAKNSTRAKISLDLILTRDLYTLNARALPPVNLLVQITLISISIPYCYYKAHSTCFYCVRTNPIYITITSFRRLSLVQPGKISSVINSNTYNWQLSSRMFITVLRFFCKLQIPLIANFRETRTSTILGCHTILFSIEIIFYNKYWIYNIHV